MGLNNDYLEDFYDTIDLTERKEAEAIIINHFTDKEKGAVAKLKKADKDKIIKFLDKIDEINWKSCLNDCGGDKQGAAESLLNDYNDFKYMIEDFTQSQITEAVNVVVNYYTKEEGTMAKAKQAVETAKESAKATKDETFKAVVIVTKIEAGQIAINNLKKVILSNLKVSDEVKETIGESPMVDVAIAQTLGFIMGLPQVEGKMTDTLHLIREAMILASTQTMVKHFDIGQYIDKMVDGIDMSALKKIAFKDKD